MCNRRGEGVVAYLVNLGQLRHVRTMQHAKRQADHLQILTSGGGGDIARLCPHIVDDRSLQPGDQKVCAFVDNRLLHTRDPVKDDGASTTPDIVDRGVEKNGTGRHGTS